MIGRFKNPAETLNEHRFDPSQLNAVYDEIVDILTQMFCTAKIVHGKLNGEHILWCNEKCWVINLSEAVETKDPSAKEKLMQDCENITNFFTERGKNCIDAEALFEKIISTKFAREPKMGGSSDITIFF